VQGEHSDVMFIVESGVVTCHMDFLRLHHRMQLPTLSQDVLAVAPVRSDTPIDTLTCLLHSQPSLSFFAFVYVSLVRGVICGAIWLVTSNCGLALHATC